MVSMQSLNLIIHCRNPIRIFDSLTKMFRFNYFSKIRSKAFIITGKFSKIYNLFYTILDLTINHKII
ncbi:hypothetical protein Hanom_Chr11g01018411 [Helianthus anomalus]